MMTLPPAVPHQVYYVAAQDSTHIHYMYVPFTTVWSSTPTPICVEPFSGISGPAVQLSSDPMELFSLFFGDDIIDLIVRETNRYAALCRGDNTWQTTHEEIKAYLGFHVLMGSTGSQRSVTTGPMICASTTLP